MTRRQLLLGLLPSGFLPGGGLEGGDALSLPKGDILGVRNIQGGTEDDPNLDIGAGDGLYHRGVLSLNFDVGKEVMIYDGYKNPLAKFNRHGITFYKRPRIKKTK